MDALTGQSDVLVVTAQNIASDGVARHSALGIETVSITHDAQQLAVVVPAQPVVVLPAVLCSKSALGSGSCFVSGGQRDRVSTPMRAGKIPTGTGRPDNRLKCCRPGIRHKKATRLSCTDAAAR